MKRGMYALEKMSAARWKRFFAYVIDLAVINLVVVFPFKMELEKYSQYALVFSKVNDPKIMVITLIVIVLSWFYFILLEYKARQTFGKMMLRIEVVSKNGEMTLKQAMLRNITKPFPLLVVADSLYMILKAGNQRLFEKLSNTEVVESWR